MRILVADDQPVGRQVAQRLLVACGHEVVAVADGVEAVEAAAAGGFDLVLLDQEMPRLDGIGAAAQIRDAGGPRVVLLTAHDERDLPPSVADAGIDQVLTKPLTRVKIAELTGGPAPS